MTPKYIASKILNANHGRLVTDRAFRTAIEAGIEEYAEYVKAQFLKGEERSTVYSNGHNTGISLMNRKIKSLVNECETLGYNAKVILAEFRELAKY